MVTFENGKNYSILFQIMANIQFDSRRKTNTIYAALLNVSNDYVL